MNSPTGIKRYIQVWTTAIIVSFVLLALGMAYEDRTLHASLEHIDADVRSSDVARTLERDFVAVHAGVQRYGRNDRAVSKRLEGVSETITHLQASAFTAEEKRLASSIERAFGAYRSGAGSPAEVFGCLSELRTQTSKELDQTLATSRTREKWIHALSLLVMICASFTVLAGSSKLWIRIFHPLLSIADAAKDFGGGNIARRAEVIRADEMGELSQTFNLMAGAIESREADRVALLEAVADELGKPLHSVNSAVLLLQDGALSKAEQHEWLETISEEAFKMESVVAEFRDAAHIDSGRMRLLLEHVDLKDLFQKVQSKCIADVSFEVEEATVMADRNRMERVLLHLIDNAARYSQPGAPVGVTVSVVEGCARISVSDCGRGMTEEERRHAFLPFASKQPSSGRKAGLGLASIRKIVEAHGGDLQLVSELAWGTTVRISLPLAVHAAGQLECAAA